MFTSWIKQNPGRRFLRCPGVSGRRCDFFEWVDPYICDRAAQIILGLLVRMTHVEGHNRELQTQNTGLQEENRLLLESLIRLEAANKSLLYKFKLLKICATICLLAYVFYIMS
ncbi:hypothetical protein ACJIZ3_008745 [Penstemon smallii]|uniref:GRF-type domain-containing protein n=1 Tax=Penstemon smallii TaxID=265156 RepID=A0ABD3TAM0_9LAMI